MFISRNSFLLRLVLRLVTKVCIALHIPPPPVTWITMTVEDADGNVVSEKTIKANSWVRNYYNNLASCLLPGLPGGVYGAGTLAIKDTSGTTKTSTTHYTNYTNTSSSRNGSAGNDGYGISIGTGGNAESFEDYVLQTPIADGTGAGQMSYAAGTIGSPSYNAETKKWTQTITRAINNNTAGSISVTEVVLYWGMNVNNQACVACVDRSLLPAAVDVPAANKLTVTYTTEMTFPA